MAAKPYLSKEVIAKIAELYLDDKNAPGKEIHRKVNEWLLRDKHTDRAIALSTVQRELAKHHKKEREGTAPPHLKGIDGPWSMGSLANPLTNHELSPEFLPVIFSLQNRRRQSKLPLLTIRQARWASYVYGILVSFERQDIDMFDMLEYWSAEYASREQIDELINVNEKDEATRLAKELWFPGSQFDTSELDRRLFESRGDYTRIPGFFVGPDETIEAKPEEVQK